MTAILYLGTDGGATGNGKSKCIASYAAVVGNETTRIGMVSDLIMDTATNNIGELTAILRGLELAAKHCAGYAKLVIYSDSMYCINTLTAWYPKWVRLGQLEGKKNIPIIAAITAAMAAFPIPIEFKHVRSHEADDGSVGWKYNHECDTECSRLLAPHRPHASKLKLRKA